MDAKHIARKHRTNWIPIRLKLIDSKSIPTPTVESYSTKYQESKKAGFVLPVWD
jgi:hypothetical protein